MDSLLAGYLILGLIFVIFALFTADSAKILNGKSVPWLIFWLILFVILWFPLFIVAVIQIYKNKNKESEE